MMVGYGGTGRSGHQYHYYNCKRARKKQCNKKIVNKQYIEDKVIDACLGLLTVENIAFISKAVAGECSNNDDTLSFRALKKALKENNEAIENLWRGIESGQSVEMLTPRFEQRQVEKADLEEQLAIQENKRICLSEAQIRAFLDYVRNIPSDDIRKRRAIINIFVHSIYLYDDHFTLIINASKHQLDERGIPLNDIESSFESKLEGCSSMMTPSPPQRRRKLYIACDGTFLYPESAISRSRRFPFHPRPVVQGLCSCLRLSKNDIIQEQLEKSRGSARGQDPPRDTITASKKPDLSGVCRAQRVTKCHRGSE